MNIIHNSLILTTTTVITTLKIEENKELMMKYINSGGLRRGHIVTKFGLKYIPLNITHLKQIKNTQPFGKIYDN